MCSVPIGSPGIGVREGCELHSWRWELNLSPLLSHLSSLKTFFEIILSIV